MLRWPAPPQISDASPTHFDVHLPGWLTLLRSSLPHQHSPPFSVPAYLARIESQCSTQLLDEIFCPHHSGRLPSERGFNASEKHPAAFHTPDVLLTDGGDISEEPPDGGTVSVGVGPAFALVVGVTGDDDVGLVSTGTGLLVVV